MGNTTPTETYSRPVSFLSLQGAVVPTMYKCMLKPAHAPEEIYVVDICEKAPVGDMLTVLERPTHYQKKSLMVVKEGRVLPTYAKAMTALPVSSLLEGSQLDAADVCVPDDLSSERRYHGSHQLWHHLLSPREGVLGQRGSLNILDLL